MTTVYVTTGDNLRTIDTDTDLAALVARVQARANADDQTGATPHYVITPWTDGAKGTWREDVHVYADHNGEPNPNNTPLPVEAPRTIMRAAKIEEVAELVREIARASGDLDEGSEAQGDYFRLTLTAALKALPPAR